MEEQTYLRRRTRSRAKEREKKSSAAGWIVCLSLAAVAALMIRSFVAEPVQVRGDSMNPTLYSHQTMLVEKMSRYFSLPERGDVVIVHYPDSSENYVKRVIGLPGDTVSVQDSVVYLNGEAQAEDYISDDPYPDMQEVTVPENSIFVMGDNRANSHDSRSIGAISRDLIVGNAVAVIWPVDQWHEIA